MDDLSALNQLAPLAPVPPVAGPSLRPHQVARRMGIDRKTARKYMASGKLPGYQLPSGEWRVPEVAVDVLDQPRREALRKWVQGVLL